MKMISIEEVINNIKSTSILDADDVADRIAEKYKNTPQIKRWGPMHFLVAKEIISQNSEQKGDLAMHYLHSLLINFDSVTDHQLIANTLAFVAVAVSIVTTIMFSTTEKSASDSVVCFMALAILVLVCFALVYFELMYYPKNKFYKRVVSSVYDDAVKAKSSFLHSIRHLIMNRRSNRKVSGDNLYIKDGRNIRTKNSQKRERYISTIVLGIFSVVGAIGMGRFDPWVYFISPIFVILELIIIKLDKYIPRCKIYSFAFYIISGVMGSIVFNYFELGIRNPKAYAALLYLLPDLWFIFDLFNPTGERDAGM